VWLETRDGIDWLFGPEGTEWSKTLAAREWFTAEAPEGFFKALSQHGWENYFAGKTPPTPSSWFTPDTVPKVGSRVRFTQSLQTMGEARFAEGDLACVTHLELIPVGAVKVTLRTLDGRTLLTFSDESISPA
jgi:hypothetical protein